MPERRGVSPVGHATTARERGALGPFWSWRGLPRRGPLTPQLDLRATEKQAALTTTRVASLPACLDCAARRTLGAEKGVTDGCGLAPDERLGRSNASAPVSAIRRSIRMLVQRVPGLAPRGNSQAEEGSRALTPDCLRSEIRPLGETTISYPIDPALAIVIAAASSASRGTLIIALPVRAGDAPACSAADKLMNINPSRGCAFEKVNADRDRIPGWPGRRAPAPIWIGFAHWSELISARITAETQFRCLQNPGELRDTGSRESGVRGPVSITRRNRERRPKNPTSTRELAQNGNLSG